MVETLTPITSKEDLRKPVDTSIELTSNNLPDTMDESDQEGQIGNQQSKPLLLETPLETQKEPRHVLVNKEQHRLRKLGFEYGEIFPGGKGKKFTKKGPRSKPSKARRIERIKRIYKQFEDQSRRKQRRINMGR